MFLRCLFFFNDTATTEIYTLSLHDALPICHCEEAVNSVHQPEHHYLDCEYQRERADGPDAVGYGAPEKADRKSTRLNSSHLVISYAVFCLKKKKQEQTQQYVRM